MTMKVHWLRIVMTDEDGEEFGPPQIMVVGEDNADGFAEWFTEYAWCAGDRKVEWHTYKARQDDIDEVEQ